MTASSYPNTLTFMTLEYRAALNAEADGALARAAMAARLERKRTGQWPDTVAEIDPYTGRPLDLKVDGDDLVLWSTGRIRLSKDPAGPALGDKDIVWRVRR
jgi:hypothetical protein